MMEYRSLRVGLLGAGSVGSQVARLIDEQGDELAARIGARLEIVGIAVRDINVKRDGNIPVALLTTDANALVQNCDIVVELMGGIEPARTLILKAISAGADIVTGNKALLAAHGAEIYDAAERVGAQVSYEAAVGGAIPIIRPLRESLAGDRIERILGIVNGTTNFILDLMDTTGATLEDSLAKATKLGYAEADPTADIGGEDAAQKAAILAGLAFHTNVPIDKVYREGITGITARQIESAKRTGHVVKLLAICERLVSEETGEEGVSARVYPALIPRTHPLAAVRGANNAVFVEAAAAGSLMFYGAGAGGVPTASAVLGDLVAIARRHVIGGPGTAESVHAELPTVEIGEVTTRYAITLDVADQPGVLEKVARNFAEHEVSVEQLQQDVDDETGRAVIVIGTHAALESSLADTVAALAANPVVTSVVSVLRIEGTER